MTTVAPTTEPKTTTAAKKETTKPIVATTAATEPTKAPVTTGKFITMEMAPKEGHLCLYDDDGGGVIRLTDIDVVS